jgi:RecA-family ATPase
MSGASFVPNPDAPTILELAVTLWGQPTSWSHDRNEARFGEKGSKSVKIREMVWHDYEAGQGGGYVDIWKLARPGEPLPPRQGGSKSKPKPGNGTGKRLPPWKNVSVVYPYNDAGGDLVLQVVRTLDGNPRFVQRAPDGFLDTGEPKWKWSVKHIPNHDKLLYRLPGLRASGDATVWITEGEKDADRLHDELLIATTGIGGAGKWRAEYADEFRGKHCVVLQDNDQAGRDHVATVARSLHGVAASVKVLLLPGLPEKGDVSDWLDADGTVEELERLAREAREYTLSEHELPVIEWIDERLSDWAGRDIQDRLWVVPEWIPRGQCTGLYGVGGVNKTDFLIQLGLAKSKGLPFLGHVLEAGPVYALFLEDSREEIIRRAIRIAKTAWGYDSLDAFPDFHFVSLVGFDEPEFVAFDGTKMEIKQALYLVDQKILEIGAHLCTLDTLPHFFGGNEIVRREVSRFIRKLDGISIVRQCAFVASAHPSARGRQSGSMESGSTGWEGGFRARLGLHDPGLDGDDEDKQAPRIASDRRILTRIKSNYAKQGETVDLVIREGTFFVTAVGPEAANRPPRSGPGRNDACDAKFLELLAAVKEQGSYVSESVNSGRYAPKVFAARPDGKDYSLPEYKRAMGRLFVAKRIRMGLHGWPESRANACIVDVQAVQPKAADPEPDLDTVPEAPPPPAPPTEAEIAAEIARHLALDEAQRDPDRPATAKRLGGMRLKTFDRLVAAAIKAAPRPVETVENGGSQPENGTIDE